MIIGVYPLIVAGYFLLTGENWYQLAFWGLLFSVIGLAIAIIVNTPTK